MEYSGNPRPMPIHIVCGHYGSGKTNVAVNLAIAEKKKHPDRTVALADLDIVNP